jgi:hypothetical protein
MQSSQVSSRAGQSTKRRQFEEADWKVNLLIIIIKNP